MSYATRVIGTLVASTPPTTVRYRDTFCKPSLAGPQQDTRMQLAFCSYYSDVEGLIVIRGVIPLPVDRQRESTPAYTVLFNVGLGTRRLVIYEVGLETSRLVPRRNSMWALWHRCHPLHETHPTGTTRAYRPA